jgi:hypothetical protein
MKRYEWLAAFLLVVAIPAWAQKLPERITYTIYVQGQKYGVSDIRVSYTDGGDIVFESTTSLSRESIDVELNSRTVVDAGTFVVKSYRMTGHQAGKPYQADVVIDGRLIKINENLPDEYLHDTREARGEPVLVLQDFVVEHHLLMAKAHMALGEESWGYDIIYPGSSMMSRTSVSRASTSVVQSNTKEAVCTKLILLAESSQPYAIYYDPGRGLPVYLAFPAVETEIFLDEFYGDEPVIRWRSTQH